MNFNARLVINEPKVCVISSSKRHLNEVTFPQTPHDINCILNGWQLAKMKKSIPDMSLP